MKSIWAKVLLWSLCTLGLAALVFWSLSRLNQPQYSPEHDPIGKMVALIEEDTCSAFERGGVSGLREHLKRLDASIPGTHLLTDAKGRDLVTGEDRSALIASTPDKPGPKTLADGRLVFVGPPREGRYRFLTIAKPWIGFAPIWPYLAAIALVISFMALALAIHLVLPLHKLRRVVDEFGRGDLSARSQSSRSDEIGELSRSFDQMADRIEVLVGAERRLLMDVSHELRSPLTRMNLALSLVHSSEDRESALEQISRDVGRLETLVGELLKLTKAEGGLPGRDVGRVQLNVLLAEIIEDCAFEFRARGGSIAFDQRTNPVCVIGDIELLRLAVENVARNAIRHAPPQSSIEIALSSGDGNAKLEIRDHGSGVPEDALESIFLPFYRVSNHQSPERNGVGLGLSIARRAVALHGGSIAAKNAHPGLLVTIELPMTCEGKKPSTPKVAIVRKSM